MGLTKAQLRMLRMVRYMREFVNTYDKQGNYLNYSDDTFLHDFIYGLGIAIGSDGKDITHDENRFGFAGGYDAFKRFLIAKLTASLRGGPIDLNKCKKGQKLLSRHGMILTYDGSRGRDANFPHSVIYPDGSMGSRTDDGQVFRHNKAPEDHDIIAILDME